MRKTHLWIIQTNPLIALNKSKYAGSLCDGAEPVREHSHVPRLLAELDSSLDVLTDLRGRLQPNRLTESSSPSEDRTPPLHRTQEVAKPEGEDRRTVYFRWHWDASTAPPPIVIPGAQGGGRGLFQVFFAFHRYSFDLRNVTDCIGEPNCASHGTYMWPWLFPPWQMVWYVCALPPPPLSWRAGCWTCSSSGSSSSSLYQTANAERREVSEGCWIISLLLDAVLGHGLAGLRPKSQSWSTPRNPITRGSFTVNSSHVLLFGFPSQILHIPDDKTAGAQLRYRANMMLCLYVCV